MKAPTSSIGPSRGAKACLPLRSVALFAALALAIAFPANAEPVEGATEAAYELPENPTELLRLDDAMRQYFTARMPPRASTERRLDAVAETIIAPGGLGFQYEEGGLYDAREAFRRRRGNCLTFAALYVAAARECGLRATFNQVNLRPSWSRLGEIVLESHHVNVRVEDEQHAYEIDLSLPGLPAPSGLAARPVSDARACAGIYGNAGVRQLAVGNRPYALRLLRLATATDPTAIDAWTNLGNAYLISGDLVAARAAFETALRLDRADLAGLSGLARVHRGEGRADLAAPLERKVARFRERNPYYLLFLAENALADGKVEQAHNLLRRAHGLKEDEPGIIARLVESAQRMGARKEAARWQRRLEKLQRHTAPSPAARTIAPPGGTQTGSSPAGP